MIPTVEVERYEHAWFPGMLIKEGVTYGERMMLDRFIRHSECCWLGKIDGEFACIWGLIPPTLLSSTAYLWLLVGEPVDRHKFVFVRHSQIEIRRMLDIYPTIVGHCDVRHKRSMQWLKWLGAKFAMPNEEWAAAFTIVRE